MKSGNAYSEDQAKEFETRILESVAQGLSLLKATKPKDLPGRDWFTKRLAKDKDLQERFNAAKATGWPGLFNDYSPLSSSIRSRLIAFFQSASLTLWVPFARRILRA